MDDKTLDGLLDELLLNQGEVVKQEQEKCEPHQISMAVDALSRLLSLRYPMGRP